MYRKWTGAGYDYANTLGIADKETGGTFGLTAVNHDTHDFGMFQLNRASWEKTFKKMFGVSSMEEMMDKESMRRNAALCWRRSRSSRRIPGACGG